MLTGLLLWRAFRWPTKVMAGTMAPMEGTNWAVGSWICSYLLCCPLVYHWLLCGCHGCSWGVLNCGFSVPSPIPPTSLLLILTAERDSKTYHEIQPLAIERVSYNKNQYITKCFTAKHTGTIQSWGRDFVTKYFKTVFLEVPLGVKKAGFCLEGHICYCGWWITSLNLI